MGNKQSAYRPPVLYVPSRRPNDRSRPVAVDNPPAYAELGQTAPAVTTSLLQQADLSAIQAELTSIRERMDDRERSAEEKIASLKKQLADVTKQKTTAEMMAKDWHDDVTNLQDQLSKARATLWEMLQAQRKLASIEVQRPSSTPFEPTAHAMTFVFFAGKGSVTVRFTLLPDGNVETGREIGLRRHGNLLFFFDACHVYNGYWPRVKSMELLDVMFSRAVFFLDLDHQLQPEYAVTGPKKCMICDDNAEYLFHSDKQTYCCPRHTTLKFAGRNIHADVSSGNTVVMMC